MTNQPILVMGATGGQGSAVAQALLAAGKPVRAITRRLGTDRADALTQAGAEVVQASLDDQASLQRALTGVSAAFAMTTPFEQGVDEEVRQGRAIIAAAKAAEVPHLIFSSVAGALDHTGVPHFESKAVIEAELGASGLAHSILAPTYFYDNALGGVGELERGLLELPLPVDQPLQQLSRADLGNFAAKILENPVPYDGQRIELASDQPTPTQMAEILSEIVGFSIRPVAIPVESIRSRDMHAMWAYLNNTGYQVDIAKLHADNPDLPWVSFRQWAEQTFRQQ